jgi:lycopene cyclase domain-containing protein
MSYTEITSLSLMIAVLSDIFIFKTSLLTTRAFWASYAIILPFQLLTNSWLTTREVVIYNSREIIGLLRLKTFSLVLRWSLDSSHTGSFDRESRKFHNRA